MHLKNFILLPSFFCLLFHFAFAQKIKLKKENFIVSKSFLSISKMNGSEVLRLTVDTSIADFDEPTFAKIIGTDFKDGTIEVKVLSRLVPNASPSARGFIGVAFRINEDNSKFENIYIRPTNGRADDQVRRNHSIQYFSYPDYKFDRLRKEAPEKYESYADMALNQWITMRIEVKGSKAKLYLDHKPQPVLVINDLKHGNNQSGCIALWVGNWTDGYFKDIRIWKKNEENKKINK